MHKKNRFNNNLDAYERKSKFVKADEVRPEIRAKLASMNECFYKGQLREAQDWAVQVIKDTRALLLDPFQLIAAITSAELTTWPASKGPAPKELYMKRYQALLVQVTLSTRPPLDTLQALADAAEYAKPVDWQIDVTLACMQASDAASDGPGALVDTCLRGVNAGSHWLHEAAEQGKLEPRAVRTIVNRVGILSGRCIDALQRLLAESTAMSQMSSSGAAAAVTATHCAQLGQYVQVFTTQFQCRLRFVPNDMASADVLKLCEAAAAVARQGAEGWAAGQLEGVSSDTLRPLHGHVVALGECIMRWAFQYELWSLCEIVPEQLTGAGVMLPTATEAREVMALWMQLGTAERSDTAEGIKSRLGILTVGAAQEVYAHPAPAASGDLPQCGVDRRGACIVSEEKFALQRVHFAVTLASVQRELGQQELSQNLVHAMRSSMWHLAYPHFQPLMELLLREDVQVGVFTRFEDEALLFLQSAADPWQIWQSVCQQMLLAAQVPQLSQLVNINGVVMPQLAAQKSVTRRCVRDVRAAYIVCSLLHSAPPSIFVDDDHFVGAVLAGLWSCANHAAGPDTAVMRMRAALQTPSEAHDIHSMTCRAVSIVKTKHGAGSAAAAECRAIEEQSSALLEELDSIQEEQGPASDHEESPVAASAAGAAAGKARSSRKDTRTKSARSGGDASSDSDSSFEAESDHSSEGDDVELHSSSDSSGDEAFLERAPGSRAAAARPTGKVTKRTGRALGVVHTKKRTVDYRLMLSRILSTSAVPSVHALSALYTASRAAANLPWAHSLVTLLGRLELVCIRPQAVLCCQAAAQGHSIYNDRVLSEHRPMVVPPAHLKRAARDALVSKISTPQLMAVVNKSSDIGIALGTLVHTYDVWRASMRYALPAGLRRDVHHMATMHHPLLDLMEACICLRYLGSRTTHNRHATFLRSLASINAYANLRPAHAEAAPEAALPYLTQEDVQWLQRHQLSTAAVEIEVQYNLGRWYHTVNVLPTAVQHYTAAMQLASACDAFVGFRNLHGYRHPADLGIDAATAMLVLLNHHTPHGQWHLGDAQRRLLREQLAVGAVPQPQQPRSRGVLDRML